MRSIQTAVLSLCLSGLASLAHAEGDVAKGEKVFRKCKACHQVGEDATSRTGPVLNGIVGAAAGRDLDFKYSKALTEAASEGLIWDVETLSAFLAKPRDALPGTKMSFAGLRKEADVADLIAFLATID